MQSRIAFRLPMLISGGTKPCTGSNTQAVGLKCLQNSSISDVPNLKLRSRPVLSAAMSIAMILFISAPASLSFLASFFLTLSSVVQKATFWGLRV